MSLLEGGHPLAVATASGTSAIFYSIINLAQAGDNIVSSNKLYGGTYTQFNDILPTLGITVRFVDMNDPENIRAAVDDKTRVSSAVCVQPCSRDLRLGSHLQGCPRLQHAPHRGQHLLYPYPTKCFDFGADIIVTSLTKWLGGHGTGVGGMCIEKGTSQGNPHHLFGTVISFPFVSNTCTDSC